MCLINPDLDLDIVNYAAASIMSARSADDLVKIINNIKNMTKSQYLFLIARVAAEIDKDAAAALYALGKNYIYLSYISAMIKAAVEGITSSRYAAGWYYPSAECCQALNAIKSAWLHFLATTNIPVRDAARAWLSAVTYEHPCRINAATVAALKNMQSYIMALALDASL